MNILDRNKRGKKISHHWRGGGATLLFRDNHNLHFNFADKICKLTKLGAQCTVSTFWEFDDEWWCHVVVFQPRVCIRCSGPGIWTTRMISTNQARRKSSLAVWWKRSATRSEGPTTFYWAVPILPAVSMAAGSPIHSRNATKVSAVLPFKL